MANVTTCTKCGALYEASSEETANEPARMCPSCSPSLTMFLCGPSRCEHDYSRYEPIIDGPTGRTVGETAVCSKCGRTAFEEAAWS